MSNFIDRFGALGIFGGLVGLAYGYFQYKNAKKTAEKLDLAIDEMSQKLPIDIEKAIVEKAVQKAADREVRSSILRTSSELKDGIRDDMDAKIRKDVEEAYGDLKGDVRDHIKKEVSAIDIDGLKSDIKQEVKDEVFKKVCDIGGLANLFSGRSNGYGRSGMDVTSIKQILDLFPSWERQDVLEKLTGRD